MLHFVQHDKSVLVCHRAWLAGSSGANAKSFKSTPRHVIASAAKQSPMPRIEIASSLRSSQ
jgi:hypothetical protein